jgi:hypothetical protein
MEGVPRVFNGFSKQVISCSAGDAQGAGFLLWFGFGFFCGMFSSRFWHAAAQPKRGLPRTRRRR